MMDLVSFIIVFSIFCYLIYLFLIDDDRDIIEKRLMKFSQTKDNLKQETPNAFKQAILELFRPFIANILKNNQKKVLKELLLRANYPSGEEEVFKFMVYKVIFAVLGLFFGLLIVVISKPPALICLMIYIIFPSACYIIPNFNLKRVIKNRTDEITYNLPDALDLLTVCVEAGLGLDSALTRVSQEQARTSPILAKELGRVSKDIQSGVFRQDAFRNLANRNDVADLKTFAALLVQTDKLGTSISQSLRTYSETIRTKRKQRVETLAQQASVKMVIPLVLFILPVIMVVLLGPAALSLIKTMKNAPL
jgi:tight adherence protein C